MVRLRILIATVVALGEGLFKIDMNPKTDDVFNKVDGGITIVTKDEDAADYFDEGEELNAVFMSDRQYERFKNYNGDGAVVTRNDDGSVTIDGKKYLPADLMTALSSEKKSNPDLDKMEKAAPKQQTEESGDIDMPSKDDTSKELKVGDHLESRTAERMESPGPDT